MSNGKKGSSAKSEQIVNPEINQELSQNVNTPETDVKDELKSEVVSRETLVETLKAAKLKLREIEDINEMNTEHPDVKAGELVVFNAKKSLKDWDEKQAKIEAEKLMSEKMSNARETLMSMFNIDESRLNGLLTPAGKIEGQSDDEYNAYVKAFNDGKLSLKWAFNFVFGTEKIVKMGTTGVDLTKQNVKAAGNGETKGNVNSIVGELFDKGLTHDEILALGHEEGRIRNVAYKLDYAKDKTSGLYTKRVR